MINSLEGLFDGNLAPKRRSFCAVPIRSESLHCGAMAMLYLVVLLLLVTVTGYITTSFIVDAIASACSHPLNAPSGNHHA